MTGPVLSDRDRDVAAIILRFATPVARFDRYPLIERVAVRVVYDRLYGEESVTDPARRGRVARKRLANAIVTLEAAGLIERVGEDHVRVLDLDGLREAARP